MDQVRSRYEPNPKPLTALSGRGEPLKSGVSPDSWREAFTQRFRAGMADRGHVWVPKRGSVPFLLGERATVGLLVRL